MHQEYIDLWDDYGKRHGFLDIGVNATNVINKAIRRAQTASRNDDIEEAVIFLEKATVRYMEFLADEMYLIDPVVWDGFHRKIKSFHKKLKPTMNVDKAFLNPVKLRELMDDIYAGMDKIADGFPKDVYYIAQGINKPLRKIAYHWWWLQSITARERKKYEKSFSSVEINRNLETGRLF